MSKRLPRVPSSTAAFLLRPGCPTSPRRASRLREGRPGRVCFGDVNIRPIQRPRHHSFKALLKSTVELSGSTFPLKHPRENYQPRDRETLDRGSTHIQVQDGAGSTSESGECGLGSGSNWPVSWSAWAGTKVSLRETAVREDCKTLFLSTGGGSFPPLADPS